MIDEQPGTPSRSQKLVLPAVNDAYSPPDQHTQRGHALSHHFASYRPAPPPPIVSFLPNNTRNWRKDPAYIVLLIALCTLLLAGIAFAAVVSSLFSQSNGPSGQSGPTGSNAGVTTQATVDTNPHFATPVGNKGSSKSSQPPKTSSTPVIQSTPATPAPVPTPTTVQPTPTAVQPTPTPSQNGQLTLQITDIQTQINNNSLDPVTVTASQPNVNVRLLVIYNAAPGLASVGPERTDANGNATLDWFASVYIRPFGRNQVTAHVTAIARDQNGQQVTSQTVTVQISIRGIEP